MAYLDNTGLSYFWGKIKSAMSSKQNKITASGILKGNGSGGVTAAVPGTDYLKTAPVTSINGKTGAVTLGKSDVGLGNVDNVRQYSASNPPPYPVTSVNGQTGGVNLTASDVGAVSTDNITQTLGTSTTKVPSEKAVSDAIVAAGGGSGGSGVNSVNGKTGDVVLNAADVSALPNTTVIPSKTSQLTNDSGFITDKELADKVSKSGDTMTGKLTVPQVETGDGDSNFFQCRKFRGEGNADTYYHAIDFGYKNHDRVDFHEYGGIWSFYKNQSGKANDGVLCGKITSNGWEGRAKLESGSTMVTSKLTENSNAIATTACVHGLVDGLKSKGVSVTLPASGWNANAKTQTVNVSGVTATVNLIITAAPDSYITYAKAGVRCTAQGAGTLTFACETVPTADVEANVLIIG